MPKLADLVSAEAIARLASPSNLRLGREIVEQGGVLIEENRPDRIEAKVGGVASAGQRRTVSLRLTDEGLRWSCTCIRDTDLFCKHCVATAIAANNPA